MSDLFHPPDAPRFKYDRGQCFELAHVEEPEEYWYVTARVWNYDEQVDDYYYPPEAHHCQYQIGTVSSIGGDRKLVSEHVLRTHYETVPSEVAEEAVFGDG